MAVAKAVSAVAKKAVKAVKAVADAPAKPAPTKSGGKSKAAPAAEKAAAKKAAAPAKANSKPEAPTKAAAKVKAPAAKPAKVSNPPVKGSAKVPSKLPSKLPVKSAPKPAAEAKETKPSMVKAASDTTTQASFTAKTLEKLRRLLEEERETYLRQADDLQAEAEALASEREPGDTQFDEESGEGDTLNVERERDLALSASARQAVEEIDRALVRMDGDTYGVCERCGKKISVARLEALPYAALCIDCKSREERRR